MKRCMGCMAELEDSLKSCPFCGYEEGTPLREAYHMEPGTILSGRYIAGRVLGFGGFGVTYIAWDEQLMRKVAVKEFLPSSFATRMPGYTEVSVYGGEAAEQFQAGLDRFVDEAVRLAKFNGISGIVDIYDTFVENNTAYIVMEFLQGRDVKNRLNDEGVFSYEEAREIILRVCGTLKLVHREGMIHRDISPDNIYLTDSGQVKLLDFGASRYATSINSKSLSVILKAGYAPEEQYRSKGDQGSWSDVYALAATFYKMLTGVTPQDSMERAIKDELSAPSALGITIPKAGENAILNALNVRKDNRTKTAEEFAAQLTSDGVERVREQIRKSDTGRIPLWGKLLLTGGTGLALLFGLLIATGTVDLGQGNLLTDRFGSGVEEGYVNAPGIVNLMEAEAQRQVKKAGLDYLITGREYSDKINKGKILSQTPLPGRVIALGELLEVTVSGGNKQEAAKEGNEELPDVTLMNVTEAIGLLHSSAFGYGFRYEYSDTVAAGLIVRHELYESGRGAYFYVSAGRKEESSIYGTMRAPFLTPDGDMVFCITAPKQLEKSSVGHKIQYSADQGNSWKYLKDLNGEVLIYHSSYYINPEYEPVPMETIRAAEVIAAANPRLMNKELRLRVERTIENDNKEYLEAPGSILVTDRKTDLTVTDYEVLDWDKIYALVAGGKITEDNNLMRRIKNDREATEHGLPWRIDGTFKKGIYYEFMDGVGNSLGRNRSIYRCEKNGELYVYMYTYSGGNGSDSQTLMLYERTEGAIKDGNITIEHPKPTLVNVRNGQLMEDREGMRPLEAWPEYLNRSDNLEVQFEFSDLMPGRALRTNLDDRATIIVSAGPETAAQGELLAMVLYPSMHDNLFFACFADDGREGAEYIDYRLLYKTAGDSGWQPLTEGEGDFGGLSYFSDQGEFGLSRLISYDTLQMLVNSRRDLWNKDIWLGIRGKNQVETEDCLRITANSEPVRIDSVVNISWEEAASYVSEGRIAEDDNIAYGVRYRSEYQDQEAVFLLKGNFKAGSNYLFGFKRYSAISYHCIRDGELFISRYQNGGDAEEQKENMRQTSIFRLEYGYEPQDKRLSIYISPPAVHDMSMMILK